MSKIDVTRFLITKDLNQTRLTLLLSRLVENESRHKPNKD